ncbi:MAG TPA: phosphate permease [Phycisphaerales bacterium]|nr:phosphate permease [Phycisphaerales bacterium]
MAWNIGANDVANAMGTPVGSGAITLRRAVVLAGIFEFCGAFFVGSDVADTIKGGIVPPEAFADLTQLGIGMLAALLAASAWLHMATYLGQPVSTTHAIIGAVIGFAVITVGPGAVQWSKMGAIAASWVISPVAGAIIAYIVYRGIRRFVLASRHPVFYARKVVPLATGSVFFILMLSIVYKGLPKLRLDLPLWQALVVAVGTGAVGVLCAGILLRRVLRRRRVRLADRYDAVERWFGRVQIITACYMAFAHGANDVANAIGPLAGAIQVFGKQGFAAKAAIPPWLLAFGGVGIVIGLATYGYKVIEAVGRKITEITPTRGFSAEFGTATTVLVCSKLGLPISTTFVLVGAVMGVGIARGFGAIDLKVIRRIFASWIVTIPISAVFAAIFYWILNALRG